MTSSSALAFDTHASVKRLMQSGMPEAQPEALVEVVSKTADMPDISGPATKADLDQLRLATKADLEQFRTAIRADMDQLRTATKADMGQMRMATKADMDQLRMTTKADIDQLRMATKADMDQFRTATKADIAVLDARITAVKGELIYWIIGSVAVSTLAQIVPHLLK